MGLIEIILVGLVVGALARLFMPGRQPIGILLTIAIGILGAFIGNFVGERFFSQNTGVHWILSVLAAVLLLAIWASASRRRVA